jgi:hypothetical protein
MKTKLTPKEKAQELIGKCLDTFINDKDEHYTETAWRLSKQCALITVNEIIKHSPNKPVDEIDPIGYFMKVKHEIKKL